MIIKILLFLIVNHLDLDKKYDIPAGTHVVIYTYTANIKTIEFKSDVIFKGGFDE